MDVDKGLSQLRGLIARLERNQRTLKSHPTIEKIERGELSVAAAPLLGDATVRGQ